MSDDYLWDRSGPPDPEIARLEALLRPLGQQSIAPLPSQPDAMTPASRVGRWIVFTRPALAAAATTLLAFGGWWWIHSRSTIPGWEVSRVDGSPTIGSRPIGDRDHLPVGGWLETDGQSRATVQVASFGRVDVDPLTRLTLVGARPGDYRLDLRRGTIHAVISAPPGQFFVQTPSSLAIDLGCAYSLTVDETGSGFVRVTAGWVGFEFRGREAFIPAGSVCPTRPGHGPGTPYHQRSSAEVKAALDTIDFAGAGDPKAALTRVLEESGERDEVMLWHLLTRVEGEERDRVYDRLARFVLPPSGVTREGIRAGQREMLDAWWDALQLGPISMWRTWKQRWTGK